MGSATFDERVGLNHTNGQITHHIGSNVDAERDLIMSGLKSAGCVQEDYYKDGFHQNLEGRNGGGDFWKTDGRLGVIVLRREVPRIQSVEKQYLPFDRRQDPSQADRGRP